MNEMQTGTIDYISPDTIATLSELFRERVSRSPDKIAYRYFDASQEAWLTITWKEMEAEVNRWQAAFLKEPLKKGDRVAVMLPNCKEWVCFDIAAHSLGLAVVSLYINDRPDNISFVLQDAGVKVLLCEGADMLHRIEGINPQLDGLVRVLTLNAIPEEVQHERFRCIHDWLPEGDFEPQDDLPDGDAMATLIYTSGTTGRPKGVMLSHQNILKNAYAGIQSISVYPEDEFLSFLPLSHSLERAIGYYVPMMSGARVAFSRSIEKLAEDLLEIKPTIMISVPRIYERVYLTIFNKLKEKPPAISKLFHSAVSVGWQRFQHSQGRAGWSPKLLLWPLLNKLVAGKVMEKFGGKLRFVICGGAPLSERVAKVFISLGLNIQQGYGLTETSPVIAVNRLDNNIPAGVGLVLPGIEVKTNEDDEILTKSDCVMLGYWNNVAATEEMIDMDGWLHTGDKGRIEDGHIFITGRIKDIVVLANGEKVNASDMAGAIAVNPLFSQCIVIGEGKPFLSMLAVLDPAEFKTFAKRTGLIGTEDVSSKEVEEKVIKEIAQLLHDFPGYAQVHRAYLTLDPWTIESGLMTTTLKLRRSEIIKRFQPQIEKLYEGH